MKTMKRRLRLRGITKWGGVTLCVLLFALWLASGWWELGIEYGVQDARTKPPSDVYFVYLSGGDVYFQSPIPPYCGGDWWWHCNRLEHRFWFGSGVYFVWFHSPPELIYLRAPLWLPLLLISLPTGFLFWSDHRRRMRSDCCIKCGYNLTGNTSGKCPECGKTTAARESS